MQLCTDIHHANIMLMNAIHLPHLGIQNFVMLRNAKLCHA